MTSAAAGTILFAVFCVGFPALAFLAAMARDMRRMADKIDSIRADPDRFRRLGS